MPETLPSLNKSPAELLSQLPKDRRAKILESLTPEETRNFPWDWRGWWARPDQLAPLGDWRTWLALAGRGFGKMLALDTPLPTPGGWTTMRNVRVGDSVFDEAGKPCRVTHVHPIQFAAEAYRVQFADGSHLDACAEHQWVTWDHPSRKAYLRSQYEDKSQFPADWPTWRVKRRSGNYRLSKEVVEPALADIARGLSLRESAKKHGICRMALAKHARGARQPKPPRAFTNSHGPKVRTTLDILNSLRQGARGDLNHCIPCALPLECAEVSLPIDPYLLGCWLGDGSSSGSEITTADDEIAQAFEDAGYALRFYAQKSAAATYGIVEDKEDLLDGTTGAPINGRLCFRSQLRQSGLLGAKHVPGVYLRASTAQRLALLQGLMDTDGGNEGAGFVSFTNCNKGIADSVYELAVSLGMRASRDERIPICGNNGVAGQLAYRVSFSPTLPVFRLSRKLARLNLGASQALRRRHRMIVSVERIRSVPMRCITVDSPHSMYLAGSAMVPTHNTRVLVEFAREEIEASRAGRIAVIAPTASAVRDVLVEGESGILAISPDHNRPIYEPSKRRLTWPNGAIATTYSADEPDRLRGPQHDLAICDELAAWRYSTECLDMLMFGLRLGNNPRVAIATTPRPIKIVRDLLAREGKDVVVTRGSTFANRQNLAPAFIEQILKRYEGTRLGRQEIYGELLDDTPGALWNRANLEATRVLIAPPLQRIVIAIDPAGSTSEGSDETGIIAAGLGHDSHGYILADLSRRYSPTEWANKAISAYRELKADRIIVERNYGGDMVKATIESIDPNVQVKEVDSSRGKVLRAEPVSALFEQSRAHIVGALDQLEDQMCMFTSDWDRDRDGSPDRIDAAVFAITELMLGLPAGGYFNVDSLLS